MHELLTALTAAWNSRDISQVIPFYAPDYRGIDVGLAAPQVGLEGLTKMLTYYWQAFPDLVFIEEERVVENDCAAIIGLVQGTHLGRIMNIPPSGRKVATCSVVFLRFKDGEIRYARYIWDVAGVLRNLGLLPELPST